MDNIYIFETRELDYLSSYMAKAKILGYKPIVISNRELANLEKLKNLSRLTNI